MKTQEKTGILILSKGIISLLICCFMLSAQAQNFRNTGYAATEKSEIKNSEGNIITNSVDSGKIENQNIHNNVKFCRHEFSIWSAGGFSALNYKPQFGNKNMKAGGTFGLGYTFYIAKWIGIHSGAELALYNTTFGLKNLKDSYTRYGFDDLTPDWTGKNELIDYHTELQKYNEKQRLYSLNIPLMLQFQAALPGGEHQFYVSAGAKLGIPLKASYRVSDATLYTWYYDYKSNQEFRPDPADYGNTYLEDLGCFYKLPYSTGKQDLKFKLAGLASLETGVKWALNPKLSLYTGVYVDYGFTNIAKRSGDNFFVFDPDTGEMTSNSILTSQYAHNNNAAKDFSEKISPLSFGVKLRLGVNMCKIAQTNKKDNSESSYGEPYKAKDDEDPYRRGYRDACNDMRKQETRKQQPVEPLEQRPYYSYNPLLEAEMKRASIEYGKLTDLLVLYTDGYEINQTQLSPIMKKILDEKIHLLQKYNSDKYIIICEGHTCDLGREDFNMNLGQMRANVVREYLIKNGFNSNNLIATSKGETSHIVENTSAANRKLNRRVVFLIKERK